MKTISIKTLCPVRMTAKTLVFEDIHHETYMATRRVANEILSGAVNEVSIIEVSRGGRTLQMLATPSCW